MLELFQDPILRNALIAGVLVSLLASYYGVFVVQRGLSFLGSGLAHAAFGGVALGLLLEQPPLWVALPFTVVIALAIMAVRQRAIISGDTAIGIFFAIAVALGAIFIRLKRDFAGEAFSYLFGSILLVRTSDLYIAGTLVILTALLLPFWSRWAYATFDRELAQADRLRVNWHDQLLVVLIAVVVVVCVKLVGIVMIAAFLVIPPAAARLLTRTFLTMTALAIALGVGSSIVGLRISAATDSPSGATIILVQAAVFFLALGLSLLQRRVPRPSIQ